jgi:hypothetical protein
MQPDSKRSKQPRTSVRINARLDKSLAAYVTAASAAGVGILAIAQPAHAKVVYTPANVTAINGSLAIDFNGDGVTDLSFYGGNYAYDSSLLAYAGNNRIMNAYHPSSVLNWGAPIGPKGAFTSNRALLIRVGRHFGCSGSSGNWKNKRNNYLGVQFSIAGQTHYGWIRLTIGRQCHNNGGDTFLMSGYAYETIPNKPIIAGFTSGPKVAEGALNLAPAPTRPPASLGLLALGRDGLNIWRREEESA